MAVRSCELWSERSTALPDQEWTYSEEDEADVSDQSLSWDKNCASPCRSPTIDRRLPEPLNDSIEQLRSCDEDEMNEESLFFNECDAVYMSDEEENLRFSDKRPGDQDAIAECVLSVKRLKKLNTDLQKSLDVSEDCNSVLRAENTTLRSQIKILRQFAQDDRNRKVELDNPHAAKLELEQICNALQASKKLLEKENEALKDEKDATASELSNILAEKEVHKRKSEECSQLLMALQQEMEENGLHHSRTKELIQEKDVLIQQLEDTISEYRTIKQDMKDKIQDLEGQLALALVKGSGCNFMVIDNTSLEDVQPSISLGEELGILPVSQMNYISQEEETDEGNDKEEENVVEEGKKNEENLDELKEEKVQYTKEDEAEVLGQPHYLRRWQMERKENLKKVAHAARVLGIGFLVPLGLLRALFPVLCSWAGLSCADLVSLTARRLIEPYYSFYHIGLPPF
ncbi:myosin-10 isoform X1 [Astyanax mexicanus]|uniref:myosin-10 isoform X1 n=1 Tax=Astyanax mexicanus TaxID=7994 RepID=UPI000BBD6AE3|nr:myosin-10 isoform X1 [Astyanax mexicanus]XP_049318897.1 myosin-10 isoform X1 [Astyanax mexicanus]